MSAKRIETEAERRARYAAKDVTDKLGLKPGLAVRVVGKGDRALLDKVRAKVGRNEPCPCGSGKKYKKCHGAAVPVATGADKSNRP